MTESAAEPILERAHPPLTATDLKSMRKRKVVLPVVLFFITCLSTFIAGACGWGQTPPMLAGSDGFLGVRYAVLTNWYQGVIYMAAVLSILFAHEMGHFVATLICRIPASLPFFIPFPLSPIGTLGAVIGMAGHKADRRQIFDIGLAGPIAGLVVAIPVLFIGIREIDMSLPGTGPFAIDCPILVRMLFPLFHPEDGPITQLWVSQMNPWFMAAWVGLLITGLNMVPMSQLDGGHVVYCLFGRKWGRIVARTFLLTAIASVVFFDIGMWMLMILLVTLMGVDHPPTSDDSVPLGGFRTVLGYTSLLIPVLCFPVRGLILNM